MTTAKKMPDKETDSGATTRHAATLWAMADTLRGSFEPHIAEHTLWVLPGARWTRLEAAQEPRFGQTEEEVTA